MTICRCYTEVRGWQTYRAELTPLACGKALAEASCLDADKGFLPADVVELADLAESVLVN